MRAAALVLLCSLIFGAASVRSAPPPLGENFTLPDPVLTMVWIPPGTFLMSNPNGAGDDTIVTLTRGYWLGRTEVTQAQWAAVVAHIPIYRDTPRPSFHRGSERPVEQVSRQMAVLFCAKLTELERAAGRVPEGYEYCLPTEAQWEYACRAGDTGKYPAEIADLAWYDANSGGVTHPVARKLPNAWGLYDMQGNVNEFCADWLANYPGGRVDDPAGPATGVNCVIRGASANKSVGHCHPGLRFIGRDGGFTSFLGFRLALSPVRTTATPAPAAH